MSLHEMGDLMDALRVPMTKTLPGGPWSEAYVISLLRGSYGLKKFDAVEANGFRYTLTSKEEL